MNQITKHLRECIKKYYAGWLVCEDPGCTGILTQNVAWGNSSV